LAGNKQALNTTSFADYHVPWHRCNLLLGILQLLHLLTILMVYYAANTLW